MGKDCCNGGSRSGGSGDSSSSDRDARSSGGGIAVKSSGRFATGEQALKQALTTGVKLVLLGEMSTGKTSVVSRLVKNTFTNKVEATIGASFLVHRMPVEGRVIKLDIWDTAGQERFRGLAPLYFRGARAAVIVYDITNKESFETMKYWVSKVDKDAVLALVGNKLDLEAERAVQTKQALDYVRQIEEGGGQRPIFRECSAKTGDGVHELFTDVCNRLVELAEKEP
eukprot:m51a1_g4909 putative rab gtpase (226) ;mRNA; f:180885-182108